MNHAVGGRAPDAFRANDLLQAGSDLVEFVGRALRFVRRVGNDPEATGPRNHRARPAFALVVVHGEAGVNPGNGDGVLGEQEQGVQQTDGEE